MLGSGGGAPEVWLDFLEVGVVIGLDGLLCAPLHGRRNMQVDVPLIGRTTTRK